MSDIVDELRAWSSDFINRNSLLDKAADEIVRLRAENERLKKEDRVISSNRMSFM